MFFLVLSSELYQYFLFIIDTLTYSNLKQAIVTIKLK